MTSAEIAATLIAAVGLLAAGGSAAIAFVALWRTGEAEKREREAIVAVRKVWCGTPGIDDSMIPGVAMYWLTPNRQPATPEQQFVIVMESDVDERTALARGTDDDIRLILRAASPANLTDKDGPGGRNTHHVMLEIRNVGRWAATGVKIDCTVSGMFSDRFEANSRERSFPDQAISFDALAPNEPHYVEIRNMTGTPSAVEFVAVSAGKDQPIRLAPSAPVELQSRGYRS